MMLEYEKCFLEIKLHTRKQQKTGRWKGGARHFY